MQGMTLQITLTREQMEELAQMVAAAIQEQARGRREEILARYGEVCTRSEACEMLNISRTTLYRMIQDGRIKAGCDGSRIDVRSVADYMDLRARC